MKFVALAAITKFDDFYAASLYDEKMFKAVGKILPVEFRRTMCYKTEEERDKINNEIRDKMEKNMKDTDEGTKELGKSAALREGLMFNNPREGHWMLYFLRFV